MGGVRIIGVVLIVLGAAALAYRSFTYTKETHTTKLGSIELSVKEKETVEVPVWAGVAVIAAGAGILLAGGRRR